MERLHILRRRGVINRISRVAKKLSTVNINENAELQMLDTFEGWWIRIKIFPLQLFWIIMDVPIFDMLGM